MKIGIDKIDFYTPPQYLDLVDLAHARQVDPNKYLIGIGQKKMAVAHLDQDIVAMAANAAEKILTPADKQALGLVIVATESGVDQSKAAALFVQQVLQLTTNLRAIEIKEACYGATAGLQMAKDFVQCHPDKKALVVASDIARYGLNSGGEVTQGAGAVAMIVSVDPHILALEDQSIYQSQSTGDFWRPNYSTEAFARGKYSEEVYLQMFSDIWQQASSQKMTQTEQLQALLFHIPFSKMGRKGLKTLEDKLATADYQRLLQRFEQSIIYGQDVGNIYTGSLYLSLLSLLENDSTLQVGDRIGLFSYGSGSVAELFFGQLQPDFKKYLTPLVHQELLKQRKQLTLVEYENIFRQKLVTDGSTQKLSQSDCNAPHYLTKIQDHERFYK
ncbi:hydroxymethylglutaryl-CoA synthase [Bombilactobacillus thymidiniphilus]|uniref:Hydroxymethylglutaryl-CoA synthase n=1 Tax=Bombilactobacillus thymidiniphilus TaxID=2923363 RepID=A0ABY4PCI3_9LACO|nr:hydroxymethylglutaryl-CoA synthase [Bombilactobacillus thymidiniphilus]UQS83257.1 hydroxymethylglutaryl-CoA synthase [Bombilactobacillus thymidiniphilus]